MTSQCVPRSTILRFLSQNVNGLRTKVTIHSRKLFRMMALRSCMRALHVDFFAIQEPQTRKLQCSRYFAKYGYNFDVLLNLQGKWGVAVARR